jgi:hypothetical protein
MTSLPEHRPILISGESEVLNFTIQHDVSPPFDLLAITNTTSAKKRPPVPIPATFVLSCPHTGQSSQLFIDAHGGSAQFLALI